MYIVGRDNTSRYFNADQKLEWVQKDYTVHQKGI